MKKGNIDEFRDYLLSQVGQPYLWGGQHTKLTPENYKQMIARRESDSANREQVERFCEALFEQGKDVLFGYDCSGLGMYWLQNVKRIYSSDMNANAMLGKCTAATEPKAGFWVFRLTGGLASHIGYMISEAEVVHAKGRKHGVVCEPFRSSYWHRIGKPSCMAFDESKPSVGKKVLVIGKSVRVRSGNGTTFRTIGIVHKGDTLRYIGEADHDPYWYIVEYNGETGYITNNARYTEVIG